MGVGGGGGGEDKRRLTSSVPETPTSNLMKKHGGWGGRVRKSDEERETGRGTNEVKPQQKGGVDWMWPGVVGGNSQC